MKQDYRIEMTEIELRNIEPYHDDPDFYFFNYEETLIHPIFEKINKPKNEEIIFQELTRGQQYFYSIIELFAQVYNGGIGQYFFNGKNRFIGYAIEGLKEIGCIELSSGLQTVNDFYLANKLMLDKLADDDKFGDFLAGFRDLEFQRNFFDENETMQKKMVEYILNNHSDFILE